MWGNHVILHSLGWTLLFFNTLSLSENLLSMSSHTQTHTHTHTRMHICACPLVSIFRVFSSPVSWSALPNVSLYQGNNWRERGGGNTRQLLMGRCPTCKWMSPREHHLSGNFHPPPYPHTSLLIRIPTLQLTPRGSSQQKATAIPVDQGQSSVMA